jgi:hypothetical protein
MLNNSILYFRKVLSCLIMSQVNNYKVYIKVNNVFIMLPYLIELDKRELLLKIKIPMLLSLIIFVINYIVVIFIVNVI